MHRVTLLALNRKKMTELAKETTCRPGWWKACKEGPSWQGKTENEMETLQKL